MLYGYALLAFHTISIRKSEKQNMAERVVPNSCINAQSAAPSLAFHAHAQSPRSIACAAFHTSRSFCCAIAGISIKRVTPPCEDQPPNEWSDSENKVCGERLFRFVFVNQSCHLLVVSQPVSSVRPFFKIVTVKLYIRDFHNRLLWVRNVKYPLLYHS